MTQSLEGKRVVIAGSRKIEEMTALLEKRGATAVVRPLQGTVYLAERELEGELRAFVATGADWAAFTTGVGLETLLAQAESAGMLEPFVERVRQANIAARGYKTVAALKKLGVAPDAVDDDGTTQGLIDALAPFELNGKRVFVQLHGEPVPKLVSFLEGKGATVQAVLPYRHIPPEPGTVETLLEEIASGRIDAVCFTTAVQVRNLFHFAERLGAVETVRKAFANGPLAVAVGKVTAEALREEGVANYLAPENERMGAMIVELGDFFAAKREP